MRLKTAPRVMQRDVRHLLAVLSVMGVPGRSWRFAP
jgi:hypothetical protein